ncbi:hypothetical protein Pelo_16505 [Pelomyxa schiedti]|nr:hypothetical protein Pelo_16505 [Pelomyxa schiedti]
MKVPAFHLYFDESTRDAQHPVMVLISDWNQHEDVPLDTIVLNQTGSNEAEELQKALNQWELNGAIQLFTETTHTDVIPAGFMFSILPLSMHLIRAMEIRSEGNFMVKQCTAASLEKWLANPYLVIQQLILLDFSHSIFDVAYKWAEEASTAPVFLPSGKHINLPAGFKAHLMASEVCRLKKRVAVTLKDVDAYFTSVAENFPGEPNLINTALELATKFLTEFQASITIHEAIVTVAEGHTPSGDMLKNPLLLKLVATPPATICAFFNNWSPTSVSVWKLELKLWYTQQKITEGGSLDNFRRYMCWSQPHTTQIVEGMFNRYDHQEAVVFYMLSNEKVLILCEAYLGHSHFSLDSLVALQAELQITDTELQLAGKTSATARKKAITDWATRTGNIETTKKAVALIKKRQTQAVPQPQPRKRKPSSSQAAPIPKESATEPLPKRLQQQKP